MKRIVVWDLELAESPSETNGGWKAAIQGELGISSIALYDTATERYHVYMPSICIEDNVVSIADINPLWDAVDHLESADILVGWNSTDFDRRVIEGYLGVQLAAPDYDVLKVIQAKVGKQKGWRLGMTAERTIGEAKSNTGDHAPELFKKGRIGELLDYNIQDVHLTRKLANHIFDHGHLVGPDGRHIALTPLERRI